MEILPPPPEARAPAGLGQIHRHQGQEDDRHAARFGRRQVVRRLRDGLHRRQRGQRGYTDACGAQHQFHDDEVTPERQECRGFVKGSRGHATAVQAACEDDHHGQWE